MYQAVANYAKRIFKVGTRSWVKRESARRATSQSCMLSQLCFDKICQPSPTRSSLGGQSEPSKRVTTSLRKSKQENKLNHQTARFVFCDECT